MNCKNCHTQLSESSEYCYNCGGKVIRNRLNIRNLFEHFSETFFNYDNKFLQTFLHLCTRPEVVIETYINGTRKKYVNVVSYFAIAITLSGLQLFILNKFFPEAMDLSSWGSKGSEQFQGKLMTVLQEYQSLVMMSYVPIYAFISKLVFYDKKKFNYTEQLVIYMYVQAQISIASAVLITSLVVAGIDFSLLGVLMFPGMIAYAGYCLKRLYKLTWLELALKTLIFLILIGVLMVLVTIAFVAIAYFTGDLEAMIEAQRAAKEASGN